MSWLTTSELQKRISLNSDKDTAEAFCGIFPIDDLPEFVPHHPFLIIVNTHTHNLNGEHWLCVFIDKDREGELFDSLATPPKLILTRWLNRFTRRWKRNHLMYQNPLSATCGGYVLYYCLNRLNYNSLEKMLQTFTKDTYVNDNYILNFFNALE